VSRGFNIFFRSTDLAEVNVASYTTDSYGGAINFGYPIKETARLGFSFGLSQTDITAGRFAVQEIKSSPRLLTGINGFYESTLQADGRYSAPEVFLPIDELLKRSGGNSTRLGDPADQGQPNTLRQTQTSPTPTNDLRSRGTR